MSVGRWLTAVVVVVLMCHCRVSVNAFVVVAPIRLNHHVGTTMTNMNNINHDHDHDHDFCRSTTGMTRTSCLSSSSFSSGIDFQSDESQFGRGEMHLSAMLEEGNVVVYQTGSWMVDGVAVGDADDPDCPPTYEYARIETIQIVWTHNCEHGVLRGMALETTTTTTTTTATTTATKNGMTVFIESPGPVFVEFGPEQLVAKLPVEWDDITSTGVSEIPISNELWQEEHGMV